MIERDNTLDFIKGLLIILVVIGHAIQFSFGIDYLTSNVFYNNIVFKAIYSFHMPLFMMISGYLFFNSNKRDFKTLLFSKLKGIGIPMFIFILLADFHVYLHNVLRCDIIGFLYDLLKTIVCGSTMWFLFSILLNILIVSIITRITQNTYVQYMIMFLIIIGSLFIPDNIILANHKHMFPFFCIGYTLNKKNISPYLSSNNFLLLGVITLLSIGAVIWFDYDTYIYTTGFSIANGSIQQLYIDLKRISITLIVSYTFLQYAHLFYKNKSGSLQKKVERLGQKTLFIYGTNIVFNSIYIKFFSFLNINIGFNYYLPIIITFIFVIIASYLFKLFNNNRITSLLFIGK